MALYPQSHRGLTAGNLKEGLVRKEVTKGPLLSEAQEENSRHVLL